MHDATKPPLRSDGSIAFEQLPPAARREYLDGWGYTTVRVPAQQPSSPSPWFNMGSIEARAHQARAASAAQ
jgi:hypothetical protein